MRLLPLLALAFLASVTRATTPSPQPPTSPRLQTLVGQAVASALETHRSRQLSSDHVALTVLDLTDPAHPQRASHRGAVQIYPASVIKLFYLAAAHRWMEDGKLADTPELRRALRDMIVDSSNDATHYVIDLLTGTTSGPELPEPELRLWFEKRNAVTRYFDSLGYTGVFAHKKPWGDGPYGRESQAIKLFEPRRNMLTTEATARLLHEIATGKCVTPARSAEMMQLLARDLTKKSDDPDDQRNFIGLALPSGTKLYSKAGWTSQTRHDAAYVELPSGKKLLLVIFTEKHSSEKALLQTLARPFVTAP